MRGGVGAGEQLDGRVAAFGQHGLIAEAADHGLEQAALDRIVVDDEHGFGHGASASAAVPIWCNVHGLA